MEYFDFSGLIENSPIQVLEGYVVADTESNEFFVTFTFRNMSERSIRSFDIRLFLYRDSSVPYIKIPFTYSYEDYTLGLRTKPGERKKKLFEKLFNRKNESENIEILESFGKMAYIKIPEAYFKKIELEITSVTYSDAGTENLHITVTNKYKRINELDYEKQYALARLNIYNRAEEYHPTKVLPQKGQNAWLCCCGAKNLAADEKCRVCERDRDWQLETITPENLDSKVVELKRESDVNLRDKAKFKNCEVWETKEDIQKKIEEYEKVVRNLAEQERKNEWKQKLIIPKIILVFAVIYLLIFLLSNIKK